MTEKIVDLRSDTVTLPTKEMREAMQNVELGDDVYQEDPTVNELERKAARKVGMEDALLVASGTQGNLAALTSHTERGQEIILGQKSHTFNYERSGIAVVADLLPRPIKEENGIFTPEQVERVIHKDRLHIAETGVVSLENTHNMEGGVAIPPEKIKAITRVAERHRIPVHLDGARIFNATVALDVNIEEYTKHVDSLMFCLSKGLSAPVGSILAGSSDFIDRARKIRKMLGGGMRQAGIIAAPGIIALEKMIDRLEKDHKNAKILAEELNEVEGIDIDVSQVDTNIVIADVGKLKLSNRELSNKMNEKGIKFLPVGILPHHVRFVTHWGITREDILYSMEQIKETIK